MNGVLGMAEVVLMAELTEEQRDYILTIQSSGRSLLTIINDILDFSKVEAGELSIETVDFDPKAVVAECAELLAPHAAEKGLTLGYLVAPEVPVTVAGDPTRVRQVLLNLLGNALKFTDEGEVAVIVEVAERQGDTLVFRFQVHDSGIGIDAAEQDMIFHPFFQADESTTRRFGGTGLGLAICRSLAGLMGGEIGLESEPGRGSMFWFTVRVESRPAAVETSQVSASLEGRRVLIVDDHPINRKILERLLASWDMTSAVTGVPQEVLGLVAAAIGEGDPFDVLLLDRKMPGMSGFDVARQLYEELDAPLPRLILIASEVGPTDQATAKELEFASLLTKPVRQEQLALHMARALGDVDYEPARDAATPEPAIVPKPFAKPRGVKVLLAEDNQVNRFIAKKLLQSRGFDVDEVEDGAAAVEAVAGNRYDMVLMDCQMPIVDGYEATLQIRRLEGSSSTVPIIAMTANAMRGDRERCLAAGMDDYISKPLDTDKLFEMLEEWTHGRRSEFQVEAGRTGSA
jgi:CheY-like chemotaxis protein